MRETLVVDTTVALLAYATLVGIWCISTAARVRGILVAVMTNEVNIFTHATAFFDALFGTL